MYRIASRFYILACIDLICMVLICSLSFFQSFGEPVNYMSTLKTNPYEAVAVALSPSLMTLASPLK